MLQEMKHRIKNSIAKMLAIARQTAANSGSIAEFTSSFSARMQAMAASQDMLTRSQWQKADLGKLLRTELEQVFGPNIEKLHLSGPQIELNETATQALGLTFHELATNALKYGEAGNGDGTLRVEWEVRRERQAAHTGAQLERERSIRAGRTFENRLRDEADRHEHHARTRRHDRARLPRRWVENRYPDPACGLIRLAGPICNVSRKAGLRLSVCTISSGFDDAAVLVAIAAVARPVGRWADQKAGNPSVQVIFSAITLQALPRSQASRNLWGPGSPNCLFVQQRSS